MSIPTVIAVVACSLSALGFVAFAASFGLRNEWEPWHGDAVGQKWSELSDGMRVVILSVMRAAGSGGAALAVATGYLVYRLASGDPSARWALPAVPLVFAVPAALVAVKFGRRTSAKPPLGPAVAGVVIPLVGFTASML